MGVAVLGLPDDLAGRGSRRPRTRRRSGRCAARCWSCSCRRARSRASRALPARGCARSRRSAAAGAWCRPDGCSSRAAGAPARRPRGRAAAPRPRPSGAVASAHANAAAAAATPPQVVRRAHPASSGPDRIGSGRPRHADLAAWARRLRRSSAVQAAERGPADLDQLALHTQRNHDAHTVRSDAGPQSHLAGQHTPGRRPRPAAAHHAGAAQRPHPQHPRAARARPDQDHAGRAARPGSRTSTCRPLASASAVRARAGAGCGGGRRNDPDAHLFPRPRRGRRTDRHPSAPAGPAQGRRRGPSAPIDPHVAGEPPGTPFTAQVTACGRSRCARQLNAGTRVHALRRPGDRDRGDHAAHVESHRRRRRLAREAARAVARVIGERVRPLPSGVRRVDDVCALERRPPWPCSAGRAWAA